MSILRITGQLLLLISLYKSQSMITGVFGREEIRPLYDEFFADENNSKKLFLWPFNPDNYHLKDLSSKFPPETFLVLSERQIKFLTLTSENEVLPQVYYTYLRDLGNNISEDLLIDEVQFVIMVFSFRNCKYIIKNFQRTGLITNSVLYAKQRIDEFMTNILKLRKVTLKNKEISVDYANSLLHFLESSELSNRGTNDQYFSISKTAFLCLDAFDDWYEVTEIAFEDDEQENQYGIKYFLLAKYLSKQFFMKNEGKFDPITSKFLNRIHSLLDSRTHEDMYEIFKAFRDTEFEEFSTFLKGKMNPYISEEHYYSYVRNENEQKYFNQEFVRKWVSEFFVALVPIGGKLTINCNSNIEDMLKTVILKSFPSDFLKNIEFKPCSSGKIINRQYFAYSVRSQGLITMIIALSEVYNQMTGRGSIHELFGIISETLEDYVTYYPLLDNSPNNELGTTLVGNIRSKLELRKFHNNLEESHFKEIQEKLSLWIFLFAISNVKDFNVKNSAFEGVPFSAMIVSFLFCYNIVHPDLFIKVILENHPVSIEAMIALDAILNNKIMNCEKINNERPEVERKEIIENCEKMKNLLKQTYSKSNLQNVMI
jgi:hypothetical protein